MGATHRLIATSLVLLLCAPWPGSLASAAEVEAPTPAQPTPSALGTWEGKAGGAKVTLTLAAEGSGALDEQPIKYRVEGQRLLMEIAGETVVYTIKLDGPRMTVSGGDLDEPLLLERREPAKKKVGLGAKVAPRSEGAGPMVESPPQKPAPSVLPVIKQPAGREAPTNEKPGLVGLWTDGQGRIRFGADGVCDYMGVRMPYTVEGDQLTLKGPEQSVQFRFRVEGDRLICTVGDQSQTLTRVPEAPGEIPSETPGEAKTAKPTLKPRAASDSIVGKWNSSEGEVVFHPNGTGTIDGEPFKYRIEAKTLVITDEDGDRTMPYRIDGDTLTVEDDGETLQLTRAGGKAPAPGATPDSLAGVYVAQEASVDPNIVMTYTQYLILWPDGSVGWAKAEGGATRERVGQALERFSSYKTKPELKGRSFGKWEAKGRSIVIQWNIWDNLRCGARIDPNSGELLVEKMGVLEEGATLRFVKQ